MAYHRNRSLLVALLGGVVGLGVAWFAYIFFGMATGVIAMCSWAPAWWAKIYFPLAFLIPAFAAWSAVKSRRLYLRHHENAGA